MKTLSKHLAQTGIVVAVAAAILGISVSQATAFNSPEVPGMLADIGAGRPSPDEPIEAQIEQAIEEVNQDGQDALEEIGELDTPEKVDRANQILQHMERTSHEIRRRAHDRASERFDELNDLAIGRLGAAARAELRDVGRANTPENQARAEEIRARNAERKAQLEARWEERKQRVEQRQVDQELPKADFRLPNGRPPVFAAAYGLRLRLENLTEAQADEAVTELERDSQTVLERLGELDTPGKVQRARKIRATLAERLQDLRHRVADRAMEHDMDRAEHPNMDQFEERAHQFHLRAEAAINELGELDTPEKQEQARQINAKLAEALTALQVRLSNGAEVAFEDRLDRETKSLRRRTETALAEIGDLDTPEKQKKAHRIKARLEEQIQKLREQMARRSETAFDEGFEQNSDGLRSRTRVALNELGRLDSPEKIQEARLISRRMEDAINSLKTQQARQMNGESDHRSDALTDFLDNRGLATAASRMTDRVAERMHDNMRADLHDQVDQADHHREMATDAKHDEHQDGQAKLNDRAEAKQKQLQERARQAIKQTRDRPTPERNTVEPVGNDSTSDSDSRGSDNERD